jgi:hypothetical protein
LAVSHTFDNSKRDVYAGAANEIDKRMFSSGAGLDAAGRDELYNILSNAIVSALGDIAVQAYRHGINDPTRLKGLAQAVAHVVEEVLLSYRGEVDPEGALKTIESDPRLATMTDGTRQQLAREIDKTRRLEHLLLEARRIPDLIDFAGSLDLHMPDEIMDEGRILLAPHPSTEAHTP